MITTIVTSPSLQSQQPHFRQSSCQYISRAWKSLIRGAQKNRFTSHLQSLKKVFQKGGQSQLKDSTPCSFRQISELLVCQWWSLWRCSSSWTSFDQRMLWLMMMMMTAMTMLAISICGASFKVLSGNKRAIFIFNLLAKMLDQGNMDPSTISNIKTFSSQPHKLHPITLVSWITCHQGWIFTN